MIAIFVLQLAISTCGYSAPCETVPKTALERAKKICDEHSITNVVMITTYPGFPEKQIVGYQDGWDDCKAVEVSWQKSDAARKERELKLQLEADQKLVHDVATGAVK